MRWLVIGGAGMLGTDAARVLTDAGEDVRTVDRTELDILDAAACLGAVQDVDVVLNCAAWTAVDDAETQEPAAFAVNALGAAHLARAATAAGARLVHISTDYVFDGAASSPYEADDVVGPRSAYGRTKLAGEWAVRAHDTAGRHLVLRTAWLYGQHGGSFPRTIVRVARERGTVAVVTDQQGQPTWTRDVAGLALRLVRADAPAGTYHATSSGTATWHDLASAAVASAGLDPAVVTATTSDAFVRPAPRPAWSVLGHASVRAAGVEPIGDWRERWKAAVASEGFAGTVLGVTS
ncbi:dTDP-4-dehydrorhamnose reductase [Flavimobilis sp. GY10621]|uniref:dTDP-4-dehydrorhamnose reductase n=1 Tax=Flavimobilis rhizosphaerae TaxID=2775421 RepID=A0ABR9DM21_9MICO|nr:dTDP-4-dehydrorhamnose reductase [Flavimobilis rhizosphaerae]MBD9698178.1 dTDP-4-dehydrorhamnose reductase [Flavimobilis rhizosphaerae]